MKNNCPSRSNTIGPRPYALRSWLSAGLVALAMVQSVIVAQQQPPAAPQQEPVTIAAAEVIVDVIVTDKKNKLVPDLNPADFEIYEDNVKQEVRSLRLEQRGGGELKVTEEAQAPKTAAAPSAAPSAPSATPSAQPNLIALVFDNLSLARASQQYAQRAARDYLDKLAANDWVAVFGIDTRLFVVQSFTRDLDALKRAVQIATNSTSRQFASSAEAVERQLQSGGGEGQTPAARVAGAETFRPGPDNAAQAGDAILLSTFRSFARLEEELQARATVLSLLSIIRGLQSLPGRKTVIVFSEGFAVPNNIGLQYKSVIGNANRANVSIYTIDAGGLRLDSEGARASAELEVLAAARSSGADPSLVSEGDSALGRAERAGRADREAILTELAESTGGLAIRNTNDLRLGLSRIDEDMRSYYVLTYAPADQNFDGRFRRIEVKVNRPNVRVRARSGYFALRSADAAPVYAHEQPLFELLRQPTPPADFSMKLAAAHFPMPMPKLTNSLQVVVEIPGDIVSYTNIPPTGDKNKKDEPKMAVGQIAIMALVKDTQGAIARKLSQNYTLTVRADRLESMKANKLTFYRNTDVEPGRYRIEVVARDATSGKAGVGQTQLTVPTAAAAPLRISSIVPAGGAEKLKPGERNPNNPFHYGDAVVTPSLDRTFKKSASQQLLFYFTVQAAPGAMVKVKIEFLLGGQVVAQSPGSLPPPDAQGRIQFIATFPSAPFPPGTYGIRVTANDGAHEATEQTTFKVE